MTTFDQDCRLYMQLHAKQARLKARMDVLKERIVPELQAGKLSPKDHPYIVVLRSRLRTLADWKEAFREFLQITFKSKEQADKHIADVQAKFPQEESEALYVEINKTFASKLKKAS